MLMESKQEAYAGPEPTRSTFITSTREYLLLEVELNADGVGVGGAQSKDDNFSSRRSSPRPVLVLYERYRVDLTTPVVDRNLHRSSPTRRRVHAIIITRVMHTLENPGTETGRNGHTRVGGTITGYRTWSFSPRTRQGTLPRYRSRLWPE